MVSIVIDFSGYAKKRRLSETPFFKENAVSYFTTSS